MFVVWNVAGTIFILLVLLLLYLSLVKEVRLATCFRQIQSMASNLGLTMRDKAAQSEQLQNYRDSSYRYCKFSLRWDGRSVRSPTFPNQWKSSRAEISLGVAVDRSELSVNYRIEPPLALVGCLCACVNNHSERPKL